MLGSRYIRALIFSAVSGIVTFIGAGRTSAVPPVVTVGPQIEVSPSEGSDWVEFAAAACQTSENEVVVLSIGGGAITLDASVPFPSFSYFPSFGFDPFVTPEPATGRIWVGALQTTAVMSNYRDQGSSSLSTHPPVTIVASGLTDKPFMGIGPDPNNLSSLRYYCTFNQQVCNSRLTINVANTNSPLTTNIWPAVVDAPSVAFPRACSGTTSTQICDCQGWGAFPVVLDNGDVMVVSTDAKPDAGGCYNENRPYLTWSTDGGATWQPNSGVPLQLGANAIPPIQAITTWGSETVPSDTPYGVDRRKCAPAIAVDRRTSPNTVYVAFAARREQTSITDANANIYIFQVAFDELTNVYVVKKSLHLTDEMLGLTPNNFGPDQFMPAIAIDCSGGINLMFYDNRAETSPPPDPVLLPTRYVQVFYARITGWPSGAPTVYSKALTPTPFPVVTAYDDYLGDYHTIAFGGPTPRRLYPTYIAKKPLGGGGWSGKRCFMNRVSINLCAADLNFNMVSDAPDVDAFADALLSGDPAADLDNDGMVTTDDLEAFEQAFEQLGSEE